MARMISPVVSSLCALMLAAGTAAANPEPPSAPGATPPPALDIAPQSTRTALASAQPGVQPYQPAPSHAIPPKPRVAGVGAIVSGWIMFGSGAGAMTIGLLALAVSDLPNHDSSDPTGEDAEAIGTVFAVGGGLVAAIGLAIAIGGHSKLKDSRRRRLQWQETYGRQGYAGSIDSPIITPMVLRDGAGAALSFSF